VSRVLGLVSFDCHPGSPFFLTSETHVVIAHLCLLLLTPLSLFAEGHSCSENNTRSLSLLRRSLARFVCSDDPTGLSHSPLPAARTLRIALKFSPQKVNAAAGQPIVCTTAKGARANVDRTVLRVVTTAAMPPPILLLGRARLVERPHQGGN
jgi:hypothetical protein